MIKSQPTITRDTLIFHPQAIRISSMPFSSRAARKITWRKKLNRLLSQPLLMKPIKEATIHDRLLATCHFENEEYVLIFSDKSEVSVMKWVNKQRIAYYNTQCGNLEKESCLNYE